MSKTLDATYSPPSRAKPAACGTVEHADPRVRRTRKLLQDAFRALIHEQPYSEISVQHITDRADVNRATFYAHYTDKQDLAVSTLKADLTAAIHARFKELPAFNRENLTLFCIAVMEFVGSIASVCTQKAGELHAAGALQAGVFPAIQDELYALVHGWLSHSRANHALFPESSREVVATVISSSVIGAAYRWVRSGRAEDVVSVSREVVAVLMAK